MIVSVSRRTDVPAFYMNWFGHRVSEGYAMTRNPMNPAQERRVSLLAADVDCFVFWSKNPAPLLDRLDTLKAFPFYVQYTLNAYGPDVEPGLPKLSERLSTFRRLADKAGPLSVVWRYDPILLSQRYPRAFHEDAFAEIARQLAGCTQGVTVSFLDVYAKIKENLAALGALDIGNEEKLDIAGSIVRIAREFGLSVHMCAEPLDFASVGADPARCVDAQRIESVTGRKLRVPKDKNQRPGCGCAQSVDIGAYNTCRHGCAYCYANHSPASVLRNSQRHDALSPFLID